jgi:hypothetical protein
MAKDSTFLNLLWSIDQRGLRYICERFDIVHNVEDNRGTLIDLISDNFSLDDIEILFPNYKNIKISTIKKGSLNITALVNGKANVECKSCNK